MFVISLRGQADRRARARAQLAAAGIEFAFFDGLTAEAAMERRVFQRIDAAEFVLNTGRHEVPGEIGCFASHRELWKVAVTLGEPVMIMEDDFALDVRFADAVAYARDVIDSVGYLRLQQSSRARRRTIDSRGGFDLSIYTKAPHCTMCYCISPRVAQRFVRQTRVFDAPVDVFVRNFWEHGQPIFSITPYPVTASPLSAESTIHGRVKRRKAPRVALQRFLRKGRWMIRRSVFNVLARHAATAAVEPSRQQTVRRQP